MLIFQFAMKIFFFIQNYLKIQFMDAKTLMFSNANTEWLGKYLGAVSKNKYIKQNLKTTFV